MKRYPALIPQPEQTSEEMVKELIEGCIKALTEDTKPKIIGLINNILEHHDLLEPQREELIAFLLHLET